MTTTKRRDILELDRKIRAASINLKAWGQGKNPTCDPVQCRLLIDELLDRRFWASRPDDTATISEWGAGA